MWKRIVTQMKETPKHPHLLDVEDGLAPGLPAAMRGQHRR
jgi:hypothetical protein